MLQAWLLAVLAHLAGQLVASVGRQLWGQHWREEEAISIHQEENNMVEQEKKDEPKKKKKRILDLLRRYTSPRTESQCFRNTGFKLFLPQSIVLLESVVCFFISC